MRALWVLMLDGLAVKERAHAALAQ